MSSESLGELEMVVLLAVLRLGDEAYGVSIMREIARCTERELKRGSVYVTLERLEDKGLLGSRRGEPSPVRGGRAKRYFRVKAAGVRALKRSLGDLERLAAGIKALA